MKLGTLLLRNAAIGLSQLEAALRNQVLYGGRLGTNLVELGFLDLELLSTYLGELSGFPLATATLLEDAPADLLAMLGAELAHRLRALPLGRLNDGSHTIAVAMVEPTDTHALDLLATRLGARIAPYVVPELRALYYLERHYGLPRRARFVRQGRPDTAPITATAGGPAADDGDERRRSQPAGGMVLPPKLTLAPRRRRPSASPPTGARTTPPLLSFAAAAERIETAANRDQLAEAFLDYGRDRYEALVLFLIRDGNALGWRGLVATPAGQKTPIEELSLPLGGASALQAAHDTARAYVGPPPSPARPVETLLWSALGALPEPPGLIVVPIAVKQRVVNLIYAHGPDEPRADQVHELTQLAARAEAAYVRLIRASKVSR
jgi:hypothetical protein